METTIRLQTTETPPEAMTRAAWRAAVMGSLNVIVAVLAVRLILLVGVVGGIGLTWLCLQQPDAYRLVALAIYSVAVVIPVVWLAR